MFLVILWLLLIVFSPSPAHGQWVVEPGAGWVDMTLFHQDTEERFDHRGEREDIFADGRTVSTSLFLTASVGVVRGVDAWAEVPVHRLRFQDVAGDRKSSGPGDVRLFVRAGPEAVGLPAIPVTLRVGSKLPVGDFDVDAEIIPLGEGQTDWEVMVEAGLADSDGNLHTSGWFGRRFRLENEETLRDPGDEWFWFWQTAGPGGPIPLTWNVGAEGTHGGAWVIEGVRVPSARRRLVEVFGSVSYSMGPGHLKAGARIPVSGRNMPAGTIWSLGYFLSWTRPGT